MIAVVGPRERRVLRVCMKFSNQRRAGLVPVGPFADERRPHPLLGTPEQGRREHQCQRDPEGVGQRKHSGGSHIKSHILGPQLMTQCTGGLLRRRCTHGLREVISGT